MKNPVMIFGAKGLGKVALDIFQSNNVTIYCFLDDDNELHGKEIGDIAVLGRTDDKGFLQYLGKKCEAFIASDDNQYRETMVSMLRDRKIMPVNAIHQKAFVSEYAFLGYGNMINAGAVVNSYARISNHCIISCNATVDFDAQLDDFVQIGSGSIINSGVKIGKGAFIGSGVTIVSGVTIGKKARVGAGSVVVSDVKDGETVFGNPAKSID
ncbi:acetyltransferase [Cytophagaceae bacterium ABcell3]|nr:acetyltransferase [Cytophagaceae bacterium ABcell3]